MSRLADMLRDVPQAAPSATVLGAQYGAAAMPIGRNEEETATMQATRRLYDDITARGGVDPASFLNLHPWQIVSTGPHLLGITIKECPIGQPYEQYVQKDVRVDLCETPGGIFIPSAIWPIMLMRDVMQQHATWGGMVVYMGDVRVGESKRKEASTRAVVEQLLRKAQDEETRLLLEQVAANVAPVVDNRYSTSAEVLNMIEDAGQKQIAYYRKRCSQVGVSYASDSKTAFRSIMPHDRLMARWLFHRGIFASLPKWVTEERPDDYKPKACAKCGTDCDPKYYACPKCGRIHDPIKAYKDRDIKADDPALTRCTREELDAAGLEHVKTFDEEIAALKAEEKASKKGK